MTPSTYQRTPASCPSFEAIQFDGPESGKAIVEWIEAVSGRGAALCEDGVLMLHAADFDAVMQVPHGWVVYRKFLSSKFHILPYNVFHFRYEVRP